MKECRIGWRKGGKKGRNKASELKGEGVMDRRNEYIGRNGEGK